MDKKRILRNGAAGLFVVYLLLLLRIVLFKQVTLDNLSAAFGASERTVSLIPFASLVQMSASGVSPARLAENVFGNVIIFLPFGLLAPLLLKKRERYAVPCALLFSLCIEVLQFAFALGSSDVDDLICNALGAAAGYWLYRFIRRKTHSYAAAAGRILALTSVCGSAVILFLLVYHTDLFVVSGYETVVEHGELVADFIDTPQFVSGKLCKAGDGRLTVEKSVHRADETRMLIELELTPESGIYLCHDEIRYFFRAIVGERMIYEQLEYADLAEQGSYSVQQKPNVRVWSADGRTIDDIIIIDWGEDA